MRVDGRLFHSRSYFATRQNPMTDTVPVGVSFLSNIRVPFVSIVAPLPFDAINLFFSAGL